MSGMGSTSEEWSIVTQGRNTKRSKVQGSLSSYEVLRKARCQIDNINYKFFNANCEHFARWAHGLPVESKQVIGGVAGAGLGYAMTKSLGAKPMVTLFTVFALGVIGVSMIRET